MLTIILCYIVIGGITAGIMDATFNDTQLALFCGLIWPLAIPLFIAAAITIFIGALVADIVDITIHR